MADKIIELGAGTYDVHDVTAGTTTQVTVPVLTAGAIDQVSPAIGDVLTVSGSNATSRAAYLWQSAATVSGTYSNITGETGANLDTTGLMAAFFRRGVTEGAQGPVYTTPVEVTASSDTDAPLFTSYTLTETSNALSVDLEAEDAAETVNVYGVYTVDDPQTYGTGDGQLIVDGLLADGVTSAPLTFGPQAIVTGSLVTFSDDISSLPSGQAELHLALVDPSGNVSQPDVETFVIDPTLNTFFADSFDVNDGAIVTRTGWDLFYQSTGSQTANVSGGELVFSATTGESVAAITTDAPASENQRVAFTLSSGASSSGLITLAVRVTPDVSPASITSFSGYALRIDQGGTPDVSLVRFDNGALTGLGVVPGSYDSQTGDTFMLEALDGVIRVFINGTEQLTYTDPSPILASGVTLVGFDCFSTSSIGIDDFDFQAEQ